MESLVYVVDDDPDVCKALARLLGSEGFRVAISHSTQAFLASHDPGIPACIVLDLAMPGMTGLELQACLQENGVRCPVIFLTGHGDIQSSVRAMKAGAMDFLTKPVDAEALLQAVRQALDVDEAAHRNARQHQDARALFETLTPREKELVPYLLTGRLNKQIAGDLGIAEKTIKVHRSRVMHKLGVRTPVELLAFLERSGLRRD